MSRTTDEQWAIDLAGTWGTELARADLPPERFAQAPGELEELANWLAEIWPGGRTGDQQWAIDLALTWRAELARPDLAGERLAQAPGELRELANWLAEVWPVQDVAAPVAPPVAGFTLGRPVDGQWPINEENLFGANPEMYVRLGYLGHPGTDFKCRQGSPVYASEGGRVKLASLFGSAGNAVRIAHDWCDTRYCHLSEIQVEEGQEVARGEQIGLSGGTPGTPGAGYTDGPHLHWDVFLHGEPADNGYGGRVDGSAYLA